MISQDIFVNMSHWSEIYQARTTNGILVGERICAKVLFAVLSSPPPQVYIHVLLLKKVAAKPVHKTVFHVLFH